MSKRMVKLFISWSGKISYEIANKFKEWLNDIFPDIEIFVSNDDLRYGRSWEDGLRKELNKTNYGIICLTKTNLNSNWILFESGGILKGKPKSIIWTLLYNVDEQDIKRPLGMFQHCKINKKGILKLIKEINQEVGENNFDEKKLEYEIFDKRWPYIQKEINKLKKNKTNLKNALNDIDKEIEWSRNELNRLENIKKAFPIHKLKKMDETKLLGLPESTERSIEEQKEYIKKKEKTKRITQKAENEMIKCLELPKPNWEDFGDYSDEDFVEAMYNRILCRKSDKKGKTDYVNQLKIKLSRIDVIDDIWDSKERKKKEVKYGIK